MSEFSHVAQQVTLYALETRLQFATWPLTRL